ncbi:hypothetical protein B0H14DRAFT_2557369 [Mycena olivaceomarginata]|nr:hypothetical protein B0H14DRAFT_2557369 [Mycena olivaceomarginata]
MQEHGTRKTTDLVSVNSRTTPCKCKIRAVIVALSYALNEEEIQGDLCLKPRKFTSSSAHADTERKERHRKSKATQKGTQTKGDSQDKAEYEQCGTGNMFPVAAPRRTQTQREPCRSRCPLAPKTPTRLARCSGSECAVVSLWVVFSWLDFAEAAVSTGNVPNTKLLTASMASSSPHAQWEGQNSDFLKDNTHRRHKKRERRAERRGALHLQEKTNTRSGIARDNKNNSDTGKRNWRPADDCKEPTHRTDLRPLMRGNEDEHNSSKPKFLCSDLQRMTSTAPTRPARNRQVSSRIANDDNSVCLSAATQNLLSGVCCSRHADDSYYLTAGSKTYHPAVGEEPSHSEDEEADRIRRRYHRKKRAAKTKGEKKVFPSHTTFVVDPDINLRSAGLKELLNGPSAPKTRAAVVIGIGTSSLDNQDLWEGW